MILLALGEECPPIYVDPAILMPEIYVPERTSVKYETSLILHHRTNINNTEATDESKYQINLDEFIGCSVSRFGFELSSFLVSSGSMARYSFLILVRSASLFPITEPKKTF